MGFFSFLRDSAPRGSGSRDSGRRGPGPVHPNGPPRASRRPKTGQQDQEQDRDWSRDPRRPRTGQRDYEEDGDRSRTSRRPRTKQQDYEEDTNRSLTTRGPRNRQQDYEEDTNRSLTTRGSMTRQQDFEEDRGRGYTTYSRTFIGPGPHTFELPDGRGMLSFSTSPGRGSTFDRDPFGDPFFTDPYGQGRRGSNRDDDHSCRQRSSRNRDPSPPPRQRSSWNRDPSPPARRRRPAESFDSRHHDGRSSQRSSGRNRSDTTPPSRYSGEQERRRSRNPSFPGHDWDPSHHGSRWEDGWRHDMMRDMRDNIWR
ncbi:hypothetical protein FZEAL_10316 [Fusarium zealandicum]|uniref:Uncharacterized protein n=1 Tax=Fusarium zealandicum TaxID=1053134 RepID=A0A8H4XCB9_9HYPO|nr:hypothetical protein FZEAL_10316 [Fusarium zealandicum]